MFLGSKFILKSFERYPLPNLICDRLNFYQSHDSIGSQFVDAFSFSPSLSRRVAEVRFQMPFLFQPIQRIIDCPEGPVMACSSFITQRIHRVGRGGTEDLPADSEQRNQ